MRGILRRRPRWTIVTAAPNTEGALQWGDTWFAKDLADALISMHVLSPVVARRTLIVTVMMSSSCCAASSASRLVDLGVEVLDGFFG